MSVLISGSIAYDNILSYGARFSDHLIASSLDHINLSFVTDSMTRNYGGCAANIAYSLKQLGGDPLVIGAVGTDGSDFLYRFDEQHIDHCVIKLNDTYTAQCFVTTDTTGAQIAAFNPGAMLRSQQAKFPESAKIELGIVTPDGKQAMIERAQQFVDHKIPFVFDIGQGVTLFNGDEIKDFIEKATYVAASAYEMDMISHLTGWSIEDIASRVEALIVTHGENGSCVYTQGSRIDVKACTVEKAVDPVGAGDAFRGGLLYGMTHGFDWKATMQLASVMGSFKVESLGAQNYQVTREQVCERYEAFYGEKLEL